MLNRDRTDNKGHSGFVSSEIIEWREGDYAETWFLLRGQGRISRPYLRARGWHFAAGIEEANGFLTGVEVLKIEDDLASIEDEEARECFANTLAARRLLRNVHALPKKVVGDLCSALKTEGGVPLETVASEPMSLLNDEPVSTARPWL